MFKFRKKQKQLKYKLEMRKLFHDRKQDIDTYISTFGKVGKETIYSVKSKDELEYYIGNKK